MNPPQQLTTPDEVTRILHGEIPLTRAMGLQVTAWDGQTVRLMAPLEPNLNHSDTAFGGSIASIAALAGYSLLFLLFRDRGISTRILIIKSVIEYRLPIDAEFSASASCPARRLRWCPSRATAVSSISLRPYFLNSNGRIFDNNKPRRQGGVCCYCCCST